MVKKQELVREKFTQVTVKKTKKEEATGSRWAAFVVLVVTMLAGLLFYLVGNGLTLPKGGLEELKPKATFVIE